MLITFIDYYFGRQAYKDYEEWLSRLVAAIDPIIDSKAINFSGSLTSNMKSVKALLQSAFKLRNDVGSFYDLMTAPASKLLDQFFQSEPLKVNIKIISKKKATNCFCNNYKIRQR